jgi:mannitol 2-dehydrogenase
LLKKEGASTSICGIGLREGDRKIQDALINQDYLYTLIVKHPNGKIVPEVIGSIVDFELGVEDSEAVIQRMAFSSTKIISLTITEGGYNFDPATGEFNFDNLDIQHEIRNPQEPKTIFGFLTAALKRRRDSGLPALTILSCDNIEHNGDMTRKMRLSLAEVQAPELAKWIAKEVCFPNSMVDRITPITTPSDMDMLEKDYHLKDAWPVTCEPFIQWVVEDKFSTGRPEFEKVGVQFVSDVAPYEKMKLRMLNAGHSVLGLLGILHGHPTINSCVEDELFASYLQTFLDKEAAPILGAIEGVDIIAYRESLLERFGNPNIKDSVNRICMESSAKLPKFLISTIHENLAVGGSIKLATLVIAAWCYSCDKKINQKGQPINITDVLSKELHLAAKKTKSDPLAFINQKTIFGDLYKNEFFTSCYQDQIQKIYLDNSIKKQMKEILFNE